MTSSADIRRLYTSTYYLTDCGDYAGFIRTGGALVEEPRLLAMNHLAALAPRGRALDLACGRGELSIALARQGFTVTGIDYSPDAIQIAERARAGAGVPNVEFVCDDLNEIPFEGTYTLVTAANLAQHLAPAELDRLYEKVAAHLAPDGLFVVQTSNPWHYLYDYPRQVRKALEGGTELPPDPRTVFEKLTTINEPRPGRLRRQLRACFPNVAMWFAGAEPGGRPSLSQMRTSANVYAVASQSAVSEEAVSDTLRAMEVRKLGSGDVTVEVLSAPETAARDSVFAVQARVQNRSRTALETRWPYAVLLSYHWMDPESGAAVVFDGLRTPLEPPLRARSAGEYPVRVQAPAETARLRLRITLVQEFVRWMDAPPVEAFGDTMIEVIQVK